MKIQSTNYSVFSKKNRNNSFGHKSSYIYLKDIKGNHCACCGKELIPSSDISAVWSRITRPLAELLNEGRFDRIKIDIPEVYKLLLNYAKHYPDESLDGIFIIKF